MRLAISSLLLVRATNASRSGRSLAEELDAVLGSRPPQAVRPVPSRHVSRSLPNFLSSLQLISHSNPFILPTYCSRVLSIQENAYTHRSRRAQPVQSPRLQAHSVGGRRFSSFLVPSRRREFHSSACRVCSARRSSRLHFTSLRNYRCRAARSHSSRGVLGSYSSSYSSSNSSVPLYRS